MSNPFRNTIVVVAVLLTALVALPACRPCSEQPESTECEKEPVTVEDPTYVHNRAIEPDEAKEKITWKPLKPVTVKRGEGVLFSVDGLAAWIVIPDGKIKKVFGGSEWARAKSFIAFKVENGSAVVMVPRDYPASDNEVEIHYSVLVRHREDLPGKWEYIHGENPPPKMIIPPNQND